MCADCKHVSGQVVKLACIDTLHSAQSIAYRVTVRHTQNKQREPGCVLTVRCVLTVKDNCLSGLDQHA